MNSPTGIAADPATGIVYVADTLNHRIRQLGKDGKRESYATKAPQLHLAAGPRHPPPPTFVGNNYRWMHLGLLQLTLQRPPPPRCRPHHPRRHHQICRARFDPQVTTLTGRKFNGISMDGPLELARFCHPTGLVYHVAEHALFVAEGSARDHHNHRVTRPISPSQAPCISHPVAWAVVKGPT